MAISTTWTNFLNGATGLSIRNALNTFNTNSLADLISTEGRVTTNEGRLTTAEADIVSNDGDITAIDGRVTTAEGDITALEAPQTRIQLAPTAGTPAYSEGSMSYNTDNGTFEFQGAHSDVTLNVGEEMHIGVINLSGSIILNGSACRHDGVSGSIPAIQLAIATTFDNARVLGVATHDIGIGEHGILTTFGVVNGLDTSTIATGVELFLSDTVAGTWSTVKPDIITRIGGALTADVSAGKLFVEIINNKNVPTVYGSMQSQTPGNDTYSLTGTVQDIDDFLVDESVITNVALTTGIITMPGDGRYRMSYAALASFVTSTSTRSITVELYDITNAVVKYSYVKNIPRDSIEDSFSFSWPFSADDADQYKLRVKASAAFDVTFDNISFDITSITLF